MDNVNKAYNEIILESYIKRIQYYVQNFECACISASRGKLTNTTGNTLIDKEIESKYTKEENRHRNTMLKSILLKLGYGVTSLDGRYAEAGGNIVPGKETSYFVVNLKNDPNFYNELFKLSEYFNQDSFLYKPAGTMSAILVGTNNAERNEEWGTPGYNQTIEVGEFNPNGFEGALSKMGNKAFQFRINPDKEQTNTFIGNEILSEETFDKLTNIQKDGCTKTANKYLKENNTYLFFEDYSNDIYKVKDGYRYNTTCKNTCLISEDSLSRTLNVMKDSEFAILTAYRANYSKEENIFRNRILRTKLNNLQMGVHQLVGHWREAPAGINYADCPENLKTDTIERSYLVQKPLNMSSKDFKSYILSLLTIDGETQDGAIIKNSNGVFFMDNAGTLFKISDTFELGKTAQAYSQHVKNNTPFVFEGIEVPLTNLGKQIFTKNNIKY